MYQGKGHVWQEKFNRISDLMERWYVDPSERGARKSAEYRGALRNYARLAYRIAKRTVKDLKNNSN
jgi:hypothetical protein